MKFVKIRALGARLFHVDRQTDRKRDRQRDRQAERQTERQTDRQTYRKTDRQRDRQTDITKLITVCRNFSKRLANEYLCPQFYKGRRKMKRANRLI